VTLPLVHLIGAARPNFMKVAPLYHALVSDGTFRPQIIHTGQHYDANMSAAFFDDLRLPEPNFHLNVGSGTHAEQTAGVMVAYEKVCLRERPDWIVVVGDVNSTVAAALVGTKQHIPVVHLEAGLRSGDRRMPEEINRLVTDAISDVLWTPSVDADANLSREGVSDAKIDRVGNIMIDSYELMRENIAAANTRSRLGLANGEYGVVTLHRPSNVDLPGPLSVLVGELSAVGERVPLVFAVHPRTRKQLLAFHLFERLEQARGIRLIDPVGYVEFMNLVEGCRFVITDSGGIQEETTYLGIPCLTCRDTTERPITISEGTNRLVSDAEIGAQVERVLAGDWPKGKRPELWDGRTAGRCVAALKKRGDQPPA
jgi:UDP-N-acetylglucosamine 2-epimerase (non-hydrolysing)